MTAASRPNPRAAIRRLNMFGLVTLLVLIGGAGGWAASTDLAGAVIAPGALVVDQDVKKVQHPTGGVVGELNVDDGDRVKSGDILIRLDETVTKANLGVIMSSLDQLEARQARLRAERDDAAAINFPEALVARRSDPKIDEILAGEERLFELRATAREGQIAQLKEREAQLADEAAGLAGQLQAQEQQITLVNEELKGVRQLWEKKLISIQRVTALERDAASLEGERGRLVASIAQAKGRRSEVGLQIIAIDQNLRSEVAAELRETEGKVAELLERRVAAEDQLKRIDIRAPIDGLVHQLAVHTVGGVIGPGETIMLIVPTDTLSVQVQIAPQDIDLVRVDQETHLRLSAFDARTTPELRAKVSRVSADAVHDERTGVSYYTARIAIPPEELHRLGSLTLSPGMPVEAFIQTGERSVLSYLTKPLMDQAVRTFREQ
jgi:HlyD family secretion protein